MAADLLNVETLTVELKRLRRRAAAAILLSAVSLVVAAAALFVPYSLTFRAPVDRALPGRTAAPQSVTADDLLAKAGLLLKSQTVEAERLVLRDKNGTVRAQLAVEQDDRVEFTLRDDSGTPRVILATADVGTGELVAYARPLQASVLGLLDKSGRRLANLTVVDDVDPVPGRSALLSLRASGAWDKQATKNSSVILSALDEGSDVTLFGPGESRIELITKGEDYSPTLMMDDAAGKTRVDLSITDGAPSLDLSDKDGKTRASLEVDPKDAPQLNLFDKDRIRATLQIFDDVPSLYLSDKQGKTRASLDMSDESPSLNLFDKDGKTRAAFGSTGLESTKTGATEQTAESSLVLFDKKGKVIFRVPPE